MYDYSNRRNSETEEQIKTRLETAERELKEIDMFEHVVVNEDLDKALGDFENIINNYVLDEK